MECQEENCNEKTNGAYWKTKPICYKCWAKKKNNNGNPFKIIKFYQKWIKES